MIDTHIHLYDERYNEMIEDVIHNSKLAGVKHIIVVACGLDEIDKAVSLKAKYDDFISLAFGFHPVDAAKVTEKDLVELNKLISLHHPVAVGEIGLDYHWYPEQKDVQIKILKSQLKIAEQHNLPIIIHNREATEDIYEVLTDYKGDGVIHSFSEGAYFAKKFVDLGFKLGISGPITFKNGHSQKEAVREISLENLMLETDGPYLTPEPYRGKLNMPYYIEYIATEIAFQKGVSVEEVKSVTTGVAVDLFGIDVNA